MGFFFVVSAVKMANCSDFTDFHIFMPFLGVFDTHFDSANIKHSLEQTLLSELCCIIINHYVKFLSLVLKLCKKGFKLKRPFQVIFLE